MLPDGIRPLYATAFYAGLRRGELRGLRWENVDLAGRRIHVKRSWDDVEGEIEPKSRKGARTVPIFPQLQDHLVEHKARSGRDGRAFVFGSKSGGPFTPSNVGRQATKTWQADNKKRREQGAEVLTPIGLHECRHTFGALCVAAEVPMKVIQEWMGHSSITMTMDTYGHLLRDHEEQMAERMGLYLERERERGDTQGRLEQLDS